ncbi:S8 family serine peptidase [bacterium]|nr:S8 family serine peptidase [bacterium]
MKKLTLLGFALMFTMILTTASFAGLADITTPVREMIDNADPQEYIRVAVLMAERPDADYLHNLVQGLSRKERQKVVWREVDYLARVTQEELLTYLEEKQGLGEVEFYRSLKIANGVQIRAQAHIILEVAERFDIARVIDDRSYPVFPEPKGPSARTDELDEVVWSVDIIDAPLVWQDGWTGEGIVVGVIDTGADYTHPDLADHLWDGGDEFPNHGYDFDNNDDDPMDDHGHGTHCSGSVLGDGTGGDTTGVAYNATLMILKVSIAIDEAAQATIWAAQDFGLEHGVDVTSMSLGYMPAWNPDRTQWRDQYVVLNEAGIVNVVAAGNEGGTIPPNSCRTPGDVPSPWANPDEIEEGGRGGVISVGATDIQDDIADFSSRGPVTWEGIDGYDDWWLSGDHVGLIRPDVSGPGVNVTSTQNGGGYTEMSGTSMATPHIAGVVALMLSKAEDLLPEDVDEILQTTALDFGDEGKDNVFGAGRVDAFAAVDAAFTATGFLSGTIMDANDDMPLDNVVIRTRESARRDTSDAEGNFLFELPTDTFTVYVNHPPYPIFEFANVVIDSAETTYVELALPIGIFQSSMDSLLGTLDADPVSEQPFYLRNIGSASYDVNLKVYPVVETDEFLTIHENVNVTAPTRDDKINGLAWNGKKFFLSGANRTANPNVVYVMDEDLEYERIFGQPGSAEQGADADGMHALAYDGRYLWGSYSEDLIAMDPGTGLEMRRLAGPFDNHRAVGYDPDMHALWVADDFTDVVAIDPNTGEEKARFDAISNKLVTGISYYAGDDDGYYLYLAVQDTNNTASLYKANPELNMVRKVANLPYPDDYIDMRGLVIIDGYNQDYSVAISIINTGSIDYLVVWELGFYVSWATIGSRNYTVLPGDSAEVVLTFDGRYVPTGDYHGFIRALHNTAAEQTNIPIILENDFSDVASGETSLLPKEFALDSPYPNPFNNQTQIRFAVPQAAQVNLTVFDLLGREVATLQNNRIAAGYHQVVFDGAQLSSGIYFVRMSSETGFVKTAKMMLMK